MAKIIKLKPDIQPKQKIPVWKNREAIDEVKVDIVRKHNHKMRGN